MGQKNSFKNSDETSRFRKIRFKILRRPQGSENTFKNSGETARVKKIHLKILKRHQGSGQVVLEIL